jgi:hypothetical protein
MERTAGGARLAMWMVCLMLGGGLAHSRAAESQGAQSASGQFTVLPPESLSASTSAPFLAGSDLLHLDPTLLVVSAERLRQHLTRELQDASSWEGRIFFVLRSTDSFEAPVQVVAEWGKNRWQYRMSLPEYVARDRFVRALVEVNLMEVANRGSSGRAAEIPAWLTEGLAAQLLVSRAVEIILPPPTLEVRGVKVTPWVWEEVSYQPLTKAHAQMRTNAPLSIEQLSWPTPELLEGPRAPVFRHCAHLLVTRLLQLPQGHARLNALIRSLGTHYNWQVAFLETYRQEFPSLLDLEKWWALQVVHFTGRELGATYGYLESVQRLQQALRFPVEVRLTTNALPMRSQVRLQTIIEAWDGNRQRRALEQTLADLARVRSRIAPDLIPLLDDYRLAIEHYLKNRDRAGLYLPKGGNRQISLNLLVQRTLKSLDRLDVELAGLAPAAPGSGALTRASE